MTPDSIVSNGAEFPRSAAIHRSDPNGAFARLKQAGDPLAAYLVVGGEPAVVPTREAVERANPEAAAARAEQGGDVHAGQFLSRAGLPDPQREGANVSLLRWISMLPHLK
jgi:hypothetical protein